MVSQIPLNRDELEAFCRRWQVRELSLFGSVLRGDFRKASDVDVLVAFEPDAPWSMWDWPEMEAELGRILGGRQVQLTEKQALRNPFLRQSVLRDREIVYAR